MPAGRSRLSAAATPNTSSQGFSTVAGGTDNIAEREPGSTRRRRADEHRLGVNRHDRRRQEQRRLRAASPASAAGSPTPPAVRTRPSAADGRTSPPATPASSPEPARQTATQPMTASSCSQTRPPRTSASAAANEFAARATGGVRFVTAVDGTGVPTAGVQLASGGGSWSSLSDRMPRPASSRPPVGTSSASSSSCRSRPGRYKTQDGVRHMGPMAQDFHRAFGLGESRRYIDSVDADGVALAAIKGLAAENRAQDRQIAAARAAPRRPRAGGSLSVGRRPDDGLRPHQPSRLPPLPCGRWLSGSAFSRSTAVAPAG